MAFQHLIIDGYSLLHRDPETRALARVNLRRAREILIEKLSRNATAMAEKVTVVFDGQQGADIASGGLQAIDVIFSQTGQTADSVIERLASRAGQPEGWLVVTNDRRERETVLATGVQTMSCAVFLEECGRLQRHQEQALTRRTRQQPGPKLGDFFPPGQNTE